MNFIKISTIVVTIASAAALLTVTGCSSQTASSTPSKIAATARAADGKLLPPPAPDTLKFGEGWSAATSIPVDTFYFLPTCSVPSGTGTASSALSATGPNGVKIQIQVTAHPKGTASRWAGSFQQSLAGCGGTPETPITPLPALTEKKPAFGEQIGSYSTWWTVTDTEANVTGTALVTFPQAYTSIDEAALWSLNVAQAAAAAAASLEYGPLPAVPTDVAVPAVEQNGKNSSGGSSDKNSGNNGNSTGDSKNSKNSGPKFSVPKDDYPGADDPADSTEEGTVAPEDQNLE